MKTILSYLAQVTRVKGFSTIGLAFCLMVLPIGCNNTNDSKTTVAHPDFSLSGDVYTQDISVGITTSTEGATIYYTTDGTEPGESSSVYTSHITIGGDGQTVTLKAMASKAEMNPSAVTSATYMIDYESNWSFEFEKEAMISDEAFCTTENWIVNTSGDADTGSIRSDEDAVVLAWSFGEGSRYKFVQSYLPLDAPLSLENADVFIVDIKGSENVSGVNVALKFEQGGYHPSKQWKNLANVARWADNIRVLKKEFDGWDAFDWDAIDKISIEVNADESQENAQSGTLSIRGLSMAGMESWDTFSQPEHIHPGRYADIKTKAIQALVIRQTDTGLLTTWEIPDGDSTSWLYGQGLALKALCLEADFSENDTVAQAAKKLAYFLADNQTEDGYWPRAWNAESGTTILILDTARDGSSFVWMGDAPWPIIGLQCYYKQTGDTYVTTAIQKGLDFIHDMIAADGKVSTLHTEPVRETREVTSTEAIAAVLLCLYESGEDELAGTVWEYTSSRNWDNGLGLWQEALTAHRPVLFANTWMSGYLHNHDRSQDACDSLATIGRLLYTCGPGEPYGLDGLIPLAVWYEGTLSYIVSGGPGSKILFNSIKPYISDNGMVPHYNDTQNADIWAATWDSLDGTSWLYFATSGTSPFDVLDGTPYQ